MAQRMRFECSACGERFPEEDLLTDHVGDEHGEVEGEVVPAEPQAPAGAPGEVVVREQDPREVAAAQPAAGGPREYSTPASSELEQWARDASLISTVAFRLAGTPFVPASFNGSGSAATAAILTGNEIGIKPMAALRSINVIKGTPAMTALALRGLVQANGHEIWTVESTATRAIVRGRRRGSEHLEESVWTLDRARPLGYLTKDNWKNQPQNQLLARATSEVARLIAADVLLGVPYSQEELLDLAAADAPVDAAAPKASTRRVSRRALAPVAEPDLPTDEPSLEERADAEAVEVKAEPVIRNEPEADPLPEPEKPKRARRGAAAAEPPAVEAGVAERDEDEVRARAAALFEEPEPEWGGDRG